MKSPLPSLIFLSSFFIFNFSPLKTVASSKEPPPKKPPYETTNQTVTLQSFLQNAVVGEYVVTKIGKTLTLIHVAAKDCQHLLLEEISFPEKVLPEVQNRWGEWLKNKAPHHQCWNLIEFDLQTAKISESFSVTLNRHIQICSQESPIAQLLTQPLQEVSAANRRKIGPAPFDGELDTRKNWTPPFIFEGNKQNSPQFIVLSTLWPEDSSPLSQRPVTLYFDREQKIHFPLWIEAETTHVLGKIQVLDSGKNLTSPYKGIPRKAITIKKIHQENQNLILHCNCPSYFKEFYLYVIYSKENEKQIQSIENFSFSHENQEALISIHLDSENNLPYNTPFEIILGPIGFDNHFAATSKYNLKNP